MNITELYLPLHDGSVLELESKFMIGKATNQYMVDDLNNGEFPIYYNRGFRMN